MSFSLMSNGFRFEIDGAQLSVTKECKLVMSLPMLPRADGQSYKAGDWAKAGDEHYRMAVDGLGGVNLAVREGYVCYWVDTEIKHFPKLTYFPDSHPTDIAWHTFLSDELDRRWTIDQNADVPLSSSYVDMHVDGEDGTGMTDPGDKPPTWIWNIPTRAAAIETPEGWMGVSIPGPLSVGVTRFTMNRGVFNLTFEELRPTAKEWGPPRVYLIPGLSDPYDTLCKQRGISERCGLMNMDKRPAYDWWLRPSFKAADEIYRVNKYQWIITDDEGNITSNLTTDNWLRWIDHVEDYTRMKGGLNLQLDQLFFVGYGGRNVLSTLGGIEGFRKNIDTLRHRGLRVGLYVHLYFLDPRATDFPAQHPEAICKPKDPDAKVWSGVPIGQGSMSYVDWTHPLGRQYMLDLIEWLISDKPGCLNADILLINNNMAVDPRKFEFHDPDWGTGDLMQMKTNKLIYEHVKKIKPECYVRRQSPGDSYMQPYSDLANLCEEWNGQTTAWYKRAHIATRILGNTMLHTDAWFVTRTKLTEYYFGLSAICQPEIESVKHAIHPYMHWNDMREKEYRRIRAGVHTYVNAPLKPEDECRLNWKGPDEEPEIWRKHGSGPLKGFFAAIAPSKRCLVTYSESEARIGASQERRITIHLPPGATLKSVEAVPHEGEPTAFPYESVKLDGAPAITLWAPDSAGETMYVRVSYSL